MDVHMRHVLSYNGEVDVVGAGLLFKLCCNFFARAEEAVGNVVRQLVEPFVMCHGYNKRVAGCNRVYVGEGDNGVALMMCLL
jgi:hypothetical protein